MTNTSDDKKIITPNSAEIIRLSTHEQVLVQEFFKGEKKKYIRFVLAALGSIPWIGGVLGAISALDAEKDQGKINEIQRLWLQEHETKISELIKTIQEILERLDTFGEETRKRIESLEYLALVRKTFRAWDRADTQDKKQMFKKLLTNAGVINLCPDDLVRLFIDWIDRYHEAHFAVIKEVYKSKSITRGAIWDNINPSVVERPRDDSAEAGLFGYLIRELTLGGVIHQEKAINSSGQYVKSKRSPQKSTSDTMESCFEDTKPIILTKLGEEFVHYVMDDVVLQIKN